MKRLFFALLTLIPALGFGQTYVHQLIVANGGAFETDTPYVDFATVGSYSPNHERYTVFDTIKVQFVVDAIVGNNSIYVAAGDSLIRYGADSHQRMAVAEIPGITSTTVWNNHLLVTKGFGADTNYLEVRDANDLSLIYNVPEVDDEAAHAVVVNDSAYIAVPGNWMATTGRIAVVDLNNQAFSRMIELDTLGAGISRLFADNDAVYSINTIGWGSTYGAITRFDIAANTITHGVVNTSVGGGTTLVDDTLYATFGGVGIGRYDVNTMSLIDTVAVGTIGFAASASHGTHRIFYAAETDYFSYGRGWLISHTGTVLDSVDFDISAEAIALDVRTGNSRPFALPEHITVAWNTTETIDVQANDIDPDNNAFATELVENTYWGPSNVLAFDSIQYDPWDQFYGTDELYYSICDNGSPQLCDTAIVTFDVIQAIGIQPILVQPGFLLLPNPARDVLNVTAFAGNSIASTRLYDLSGRAVGPVIGHSNAQRAQLDVSSLPAGVYLIEIQHGNNTSRQRFVKQ